MKTFDSDGVEIAYTVEENEFRGEKRVELRLDDFRATEKTAAG